MCGSRESAAPGARAVDSIDPAERASLLAWLDDGLKNGRRGRTASELPVALGEAAPEDHIVARLDGRFAAHAFLRRVTVEVRGSPFPLGMIGLVYADPAQRGRGLASACVEEAVRRLAERGARLALLWSELEPFYARLGFEPFGVERLYRVDAERCCVLRALTGPAPAPDRPRHEDAADLDALHAAKPVHVQRTPELWSRIGGVPDCELRVVRRDASATAYAALGRGDDFVGVVHDWAGEPAGLVACVASFLAQRPEVLVLAGAAGEPFERALRDAGAPCIERPLGLARPLGGGPGDAGSDAAQALAADLFVWGFDSI